MTPTAMQATPGDLVIIEGHHVGEGKRIGEILEVLGAAGSEHYRVRWDDGRESIYFPGNDAVIKRHGEESGVAR